MREVTEHACEKCGTTTELTIGVIMEDGGLIVDSINPLYCPVCGARFTAFAYCDFDIEMEVSGEYEV